VQIRTVVLMRAQWVVMELIEHRDAHRIEAAEERVAQCMQRLAKARLRSIACLRNEGTRRVGAGWSRVRCGSPITSDGPAPAW
jgi:hypothetical protein